MLINTTYVCMCPTLPPIRIVFKNFFYTQCHLTFDIPQTFLPISKRAEVLFSFFVGSEWRRALGFIITFVAIHIYIYIPIYTINIYTLK